MPFHQLVVELPGRELARAEDACRRLGALALALADAGDEPLLEPAPGETPLWQAVRLRALFDLAASPELLAATLAAVLGLDPEAIAIEHVEDRAWEREWLRDFRPMRFGRRLWVCPAGQQPEDPAAVVLELDPGLAFGTGTHPTTALCLEWLDAAIEGGERVLDYGCGSGILALAALRLGADQAIAFDIDPQALLATRENAAKNGLADRLEIAELARQTLPAASTSCSPTSCPDRWSRSRRESRRGPSAAARCVLAGMLAHQADEVAQAYRPWFDIGPVAEREGWTLLAGRRRPE